MKITFEKTTGEPVVKNRGAANERVLPVLFSA